MSECEHTEVNRYHDRVYGDFWMCRECETRFVPASRLDRAGRDLDLLQKGFNDVSSRLDKIVHVANGFSTEGCECGRCSAWREARRIATAGVENQRTKGCPAGCGMPAGHEEPCFK